MTTIKTALVAFAFIASLGAAPAFAAVTENGLDTDLDIECEFVAEQGGYVCDSAPVGASLSDLGDANGKKKKLPHFPLFEKI